MNKKFFSALVMGSLLLGGTFVSCSDYDDDIDNLQEQINQLASKADMQSSVSTLQSAITTAQAAAENKAAAAQAAADKAAAAAKAADDAAAKASNEAAAAKAAADAAAAKADAAAAQADLQAAEVKLAKLEDALADLEALSATLVSTTDFEAAKKDLNQKYAALEAKIADATGTAGMTGLQVLCPETVSVAYGVWDGVREGAKTATWNGPKAEEVAAIEKGTYVSVFGTPKMEISVNPTDIDVTDASFAIVNKYGDVAPVDFSSATVLTRANAAGTYTLKVRSAATTSESVSKFAENFAGEGGTATLVAGKIAADFRNEFVSVVKALNADKSAFSATVKYDEISGSVDLVAATPEMVYDAYIVGLKGVSEHDSLLWNLQYDGLTLTYNAAAAKKFAPKSFKVNVKQINPNGYIHTVEATISFEAKDEAAPIEKEAILDVHTHAVQLTEKDPLTADDIQVLKLTKAELQKALGYTKGTEDSIHFAHSTLESIEVLDAFYYGVDNDPVTIDEAVFANATVDKGNMTLKFVKDYDFTTNEKVDVVRDGKTIYVTLKVTGVDNQDLEGVVTTEYTVTLPVKFQWVKVDDLYTWNPTVAENGGIADIAAAITEPKTGFEYKAGEWVPNKKDAPEYYTPSINVALNLASIKAYNDAKAEINAREIGTDAPDAFATKEEKAAALLALENEYMGLVKMWGTEFVPKTATKAGYFKCGVDPETDLVNTVENVGLAGSFSYTISGLMGTVLGRDVKLANRTVTVTVTEPATATLTTTAAKLTELTFLSNSTAKPADATNFAGTFTLKAKDGKILNLTEASTFSVSTIEFVDANGKPVTAQATITMAVLVYAIDAENNAYGMQIETESIPETAKKVKVTFDVTGVMYHSTSKDAPAQSGVVAEFAL